MGRPYFMQCLPVSWARSCSMIVARAGLVRLRNAVLSSTCCCQTFPRAKNQPGRLLGGHPCVGLGKCIDETHSATGHVVQYAQEGPIRCRRQRVVPSFKASEDGHRESHWSMCISSHHRYVFKVGRGLVCCLCMFKLVQAGSAARGISTPR
jgi:hypothetical protein